MSDQPQAPGQPDPYQGGQFTNPNQGAQPYPQQGGGYYPPPPKKRKKWPWIVLAIVIVFIAGIASCAALVGGAVNSVNEDSKKVVQVTYEITGDGPGGIATYTSGNLDMAQDTNIQIPWTKEVGITGFGKSVSLTATNGFDSQGSITCAIKQGDKVISTNTASGPGATTTCSGTAETD